MSDVNSMFPCDPYHDAQWRKLEGLEDSVELSSFGNEQILKVRPEALERLAEEAFHDISHFLRPGHLAQLQKILNDPEASANDRFVALICCGIRKLRQREFCRCARIRARPSSWPKREDVYGPMGEMRISCLKGSKKPMPLTT